MSSYLRNLLNESPDHQDSKPSTVKKLPIWLEQIQSGRPVTYDTSELYEDRVDESDKKKLSEQQSSNKKCYECGEYGHISKECPDKWKKKLGGRFKESDWCCPMCSNINWDWRQHCNKCSTPKPAGGAAEKRTGKGGGYNEIDEETRKRLQSKSRKYKGHNSKNKNRNDKVRDYNVYISNLPDINGMDMDENDLINKIAQLFGQIGRIKRDYHRRKSRSKHNYDIRLSDDNVSARLVYEDPQTAPFAIQWFDNTEFEGNVIGVKMKADVVDEGGYDGDDVVNGADAEDMDWNEDNEKMQEEQEENEMNDIESELFGFSRRGRGKSKVNKSFRTVKVDKCKDKQSRTRSWSRSPSPSPVRSRSRSRDRDRRRHRDRDRNKKYRSSKKSRSFR